MGREANAVKERQCKICGRAILTDSRTMVEHNFVCSTLKKIGLEGLGEV